MKKFVCMLLSISILTGFPLSSEIKANAEECPIYINEVCAKNSTCLLDSSKVANDWIELYNSSDKAVSLDSYYLTDNNTKLKKYQLPAVEIAAKSYLIIYCAAEPSSKADGEYYSGFAISTGGETVMITDGTNILDSITLNGLKADQTVSRVPDGSDNLLTTLPTPNQTNNDSLLAEFEAPAFSVTSGFYDKDFYVTITAPEGCKVYYTLDSSNPTEASEEYTKPIHITNVSEYDNIYSERDDISAAFLDDLIQKYCSSTAKKDYHLLAETPKEKVDKCTVLRAICVDADGNASNITTASYFVGLSDKIEYQNVSVISLVSDPVNLFDYENGIFVLGKDFYNYFYDTLSDETNTDPLKKSYWWWDANYRREDKKQGIFDYFETADNYVGSDTVDISIKGNGSRGLLEKSINLTANSAYTGRSCLGFNIMSDKKEKGITLFSGGDNYIFKSVDYIASKLSQDLNVVSFNYKPCQLFLDGEYWRFFYIADRTTSKTYYEENFDVDGNSLAIIKSSQLDTGRYSDLTDYYDAVHFARDNDMSLEENYKYIEQFFDIDSLIDYFCASIFMGRCDDWPVNNWAVWRCNDISDKKYHDKKWRYIMFDVNSFSMKNTKHDTLSYVLKSDKFFSALYDNEEFREKFTARYKELTATCFNAEYANSVIAEMSETAKPFISANYKRYYGNNLTVADYIDHIDDLYSFYAQRKEYTLFYLNKVNSSYGMTTDVIEEPTTEAPSTEPTTETPTTQAPSAEPTTETPTTQAPYAEPSTEIPSTAPVIEEPTTVTDIIPTVTAPPVTEQPVPAPASTNAPVEPAAPATLPQQTEQIKSPAPAAKTTVSAKASLKKTFIRKLTKKKKSFKAVWKKINGVTGYQIQYSTSKKFTKKKTKTITVKGSKNNSKTIKKLKSGKKYYVRVRTYKKSKSFGKIVTSYSGWSKVKSVKIK